MKRSWVEIPLAGPNLTMSKTTTFNLCLLMDDMKRFEKICFDKHIHRQDLGRAAIRYFLDMVENDLLSIKIENASDSNFGAKSIDEVKKEHILTTLEKFNGNRTHTAKALGIGRRTLVRKLSKFIEKETRE